MRNDRIVNMNTLKSYEIDAYLEGKFNISKDSPEHEITWVLENVAINMFTILVGNISKFSHSFFVPEKDVGSFGVSGPIIYIDNDRSEWNSDIFRRGVIKNTHPLGIFCKFPKNIAMRIILGDGRYGFTIGDILLESTSYIEDVMKEKSLFSSLQAKYLDQRVSFLRYIIETCIIHNGIDNVLIPEPWL